MKVIDVIYNQNLNEAGLGTEILQGIGKGASAAYKGVKGVVDTRGLINSLSQNPALLRRISKGDPPSAAEIEKVYGKAAADIVRKDDRVYGKALNKYYADRKATKAASGSADSAVKSKGLIGSTVDKAVSITTKTGNFLRNTINWAVFGTFAYALYSPIAEAIEKINLAEQKLVNGEISEELFNQYYRDVTNHCIARIGYNVLFTAAIGAGGKAFSLIMPQPFKWLAQQTTKLGIGWFNLMMADRNNYDNVLTAFVIDLIAMGVDKVNPLLPNTTDLVKKAAANTSQAAQDGKQTPQQGQAGNPADIAATSTKPQPGTTTTQTNTSGEFRRPASAGGATIDAFEKGWQDAVRSQQR